MEEERLTKREKRDLAKEEKRREAEKQETVAKSRKLLIWFLVLGGVFWLGYKIYNFFSAPIPETAVAPIEVYENDWIKGDIEAGVTLIEYGDFQCPACATYAPILERLLEETPDGFRIVFRHFPLAQIHKNALSSSKAAEAAGKQGKFWEMHDVLFETQSDWEDEGDPKDKFLEYARQLELDEQMFSNDYDSGDISEKITNDLTSGNALQVNATPTFYLNGVKIQPKSYEEFKSMVDTEIRGYQLE